MSGRAAASLLAVWLAVASGCEGYIAEADDDGAPPEGEPASVPQEPFVAPVEERDAGGPDSGPAEPGGVVAPQVRVGDSPSDPDCSGNDVGFTNACVGGVNHRCLAVDGGKAWGPPQACIAMAGAKPPLLCKTLAANGKGVLAKVNPFVPVGSCVQAPKSGGPDGGLWDGSCGPCSWHQCRATADGGAEMWCNPDIAQARWLEFIKAKPTDTNGYNPHLPPRTEGYTCASSADRLRKINFTAGKVADSLNGGARDVELFRKESYYRPFFCPIPGNATHHLRN